MRMMTKATMVAAGFLIGAAATPVALAQQYPTRSISIVVPYAPGGASDMLGRMLARGMESMFGQSVIVENKSGASGTTGSAGVSRATPDGYTLVMGTSASHSVNTLAIKNTYDPLTAFAPVALVTRAPNVVVVHPSHPAKTIQELIQFLKANPGTPIATAGPATSGRFATELLKAQLELDVKVIPYRSSAPAITDVVGNQVSIGITDALAPTAFINNGNLRPLAVTSLQRIPSLPDVPTIAETVSPGFEAVAWNALFAPPGTPAAVVSRLNEAVRKIMSDPDNRKQAEARGQEVAVGSPGELAAFMKADIAKWHEIAAKNKLTF